MKTIAISNNKGGVSKTTTSAHLACVLAERGNKVILVDTDGQGNASRAYSIFPNDYKCGLYHLMINQIGVMLNQKPSIKTKDGIIKADYGVDVIPCDSRISEIPTWLQDNGHLFKKGAEIKNYWEKYFPFFMTNILSEVSDQYDFCIIDTPPAFEFITKSALIASDYVIVPVELGDFELTGLESLVDKILSLKNKFDLALSILGIVINRHEGSRTNLEKGLEASLREHESLGKYVFNNVINKRNAIREAFALGKLGINHYSRNRKGQMSVADNYRNFAEEVELWLAKIETTI